MLLGLMGDVYKWGGTPTGYLVASDANYKLILIPFLRFQAIEKLYTAKIFFLIRLIQ